jgi:hypothetical protein
MGIVHVHVPAHAASKPNRLAINVPSSARFDDLIDAIFFAVDAPIPAFTYGKVWRLHNKTSGLPLVHERERAKVPVFGTYSPDNRSLEDAGILPGDELELVFLKA